MTPPPATDLPPPPPAIVVDAAFPGGNIVVEWIDGDTLYLKQDLRDTEGWWFHWAFRLRGAAGRTVRVEFGSIDGQAGGPVGTRGPALSLDGGWTWAWQSADFAPDGFSVTIPDGADEVLLAFADLYTQRHWERFRARLGISPHLADGVLATTRKGRAVVFLRAGCLEHEPRFRVFVSARHHACESMASHVAEGLVEGVLAPDDEGPWLRENVEFLIVPFVDKDGVEDGDQGKNRRPHDHNRDYGQASIHVETAAIRELVPRWSDGKLVASFDLHCPWIRGEHNEFVYQVGKADARLWAEQRRFGALLERHQTGALDYRAADDLPFGKLWNTGAASDLKSCSTWFGEQSGIRLATSIEIAYATAHDRVVSATSARAFGHDLARTLAAYLRSSTDPHATLAAAR
jgi:hypothetical protein